MHYTEYALIVAGGKGTRMDSKIPKQFLNLNGLPVLMHTLLAFYRYAENINIILVLPEEDFETWHSLCRKHTFHKPYVLQRGGNTRFQSVRNGLSRINGDGVVAIHDGVRPLVTQTMISTSFLLAKTKESAVAAVPLKESIRITEQDRTRALDRSVFHLIQTPQTFNVNLIRDAYAMPEDPTLTDDASVAERAGHSITLFQGNYQNIKITTADDLILAEALMKENQRGLSGNDKS